jgi:hypothetical protein
MNTTTRTVHFADGRVMEIPRAWGDVIRLPRPRHQNTLVELRPKHWENEDGALKIDSYRIVEGTDGKWYAIID